MLERLQITMEEEYNSTGHSPSLLTSRICARSISIVRCSALRSSTSSRYPRSRHFISLCAVTRGLLHACLRAAGDTLRALVLCFPRDPPRDRRLRMTTMATQLRSLHLRAPVPYHALLEITAHLLERVLAAQHLQRLAIELEKSETNNPPDTDEVETIKSAREAFNQVLGKFFAFEKLHII
ncbi:hypothetical protein MSAN_01304900 [Mycena sanguinolenta]|uniref:Uncharacterized protein n=1 Tax=Mycena sanguinolenta TaxID=230812 RepID=A0A8H6Y9X9_9AGAR|nr:hypothetical protein MSAN_01304900 [Mycena sanguinolenta]